MVQLMGNEFITDNTLYNQVSNTTPFNVEVVDRSNVVSSILCEPEPKEPKEVKNDIVNEDDKLVNGQLGKGIRATIGRNEPCPCKSGKKYKKCCGKVS